MRQIDAEKSDLKSCLTQARRDRLVILRKGKPVAIMVGVEGLDQEQIELGGSDEFWKLITRRRGQRIVRRADLLRALNGTR